MRLIDGDVLKEAFYQKMKELLKSTDTPQISNEALSLLCGASLIADAPTIEPEDKCSECDAWNQYKNYPRQQWISCSERLPEEEYVLISKKPTKLSGSKWSVAIAIRTADPRSRKNQWRDSGFGVIQDDKVLAWMPLPEPYKERREE